MREIRQHGNAQAKRTVDAGSSVITMTVSRARAVFAKSRTLKRMIELKPTFAVSPMHVNTVIERHADDYVFINYGMPHR